MSGYRHIVPPVRDYGRSARLNIEHGRRLRSIGTSSLAEALQRAGWWTHADMMDYAPDAPDVLPAGSCIDCCDFPEQRITRREGST